MHCGDGGIGMEAGMDAERGAPAAAKEEATTILGRMIESAQQIMRGNFESARTLFDATANQAAPGDVRELAETLGMMSVKLEAREMALENQLEVIRRQNEELRETVQIRAESSTMLCGFLLFLPFYGAAIALASRHGAVSTRTASAIGLVAMVLLLAQILLFILLHRRSLSAWGMTWAGGRRALRESLLACVPLAGVAIGVKWWLTRAPGSEFFGQPVFLWPIECPWQMNAVYLAVAVLQEIIGRGFMLTNIERILTGKHRGALAVLTSSVLFAFLHLHYNGFIMGATLASGLAFGALYLRHRTIVGVSVAHYVLGILLIDVLGMFR